MTDSAGRPWATLQRWAQRREVLTAALTLLAAAVFEFRLRLLLARPYPPSGDAGGDLYNAHAWLGQALPALSQSAAAPPLYFFAIVTPFTTVFPTFEGIQLYMAFVPALLVYPGYLLVRESGAGPWPSVFGAGLLALSSIWSLMLTWNAAYNLFGILFLLLFLVFLVRFCRVPSWRAGILVAVPLALVGLSHQLTFLVALLVLLSTAVWLLLRSAERRVAVLLRLAVPSLVLTLPLIVFYGPIASGIATSGGGSSYYANFLWALQTGPFFAWGYQGVKFGLVVGVDLLVSFGALAFLAQEPEASPFAAAMTGVLVAATIVMVLDPGNAVRGLYFLPIPFLAPIPVFLERGIARPLRQPPGPGPQPTTWRARVAARFGRSEESRAAVSVVVGAFAVGLLMVNANVSQNVMTAGIAFNDSLKPDGVAALTWIKEHTPSNATFIDGANLQTWMWGYAERMDYAPESLSAEVTQQSLTYAEDADLINLGSYLLTDPYWVLSSSYPSGEGAPQIYLAVPGYWEPFLGTEADHDSLLLSGPSGPRWVGLQYATLDAATSNASAGSLSYAFDLHWSSLDLSATVDAQLDGADLALDWQPGEAQPLQVNYSFGVPPSGYFFTYSSFATVANVTSLTDTFVLNGLPFSVTFSGGRFTQEVLPDGWGQLWYWGAGDLRVATSGMQPQNALPSEALNTSPLVRSLDIRYAIVDINTDYPMYTRLRAGVFWNAPAVQLYQSGPVVVFGQ